MLPSPQQYTSSKGSKDRLSQPIQFYQITQGKDPGDFLWLVGGLLIGYYSGYSRYQFWNVDKNTPESRTRLALDITATIEKKSGVHLPLPRFTF